MTTSRTPGGLRALPDPDPERWVRQGEGISPAKRVEVYAARLTVDVTTDLRRRIKLKAIGRGVTVAELLRALLEREFPQSGTDE